MEIRPATDADIEAIVAVHMAAFDGFFLTMLGPPFLRKMYRGFQSQPNGLMQVACLPDQRIVGFAAGTSAPQHFFALLRKKQWLSFVLAAIPGILKHPLKVLKKLYYAFFYKGDKPAELTQIALLSGIAVLPEMAGRAVGKALLADFEQQVRAAGVHALYLTTDKFGNDGVVAFYQRAGYQVENEFTQPDGRHMLRLIKSL